MITLKINFKTNRKNYRQPLIAYGMKVNLKMSTKILAAMCLILVILL